MIRVSADGVPFYQFELFKDSADRIAHGVLTRHTELDDPRYKKVIWGNGREAVSFKKQLHGTDICIVTETGAAGEGDILITKQRGIPLLIRTADCAGIIIVDPVQNVIANIHAGWRGLTQRVIRDAVSCMAERFGCKQAHMLAAISPMLGPCCSLFSNPQQELPDFLHRYISEENTVNLWAVVEDQLRECGVQKEHIENPRICTSCTTEDFYSYRREGKKAGRFGTVVMLR